MFEPEAGPEEESVKEYIQYLIRLAKIIGKQNKLTGWLKSFM